MTPTTTRSVANISARSSLVSDALAFSTADIFAAGFIDNGLGKVICTDGNMAAAGGNNWTWDAVRIYNPDFRLDAKLKPDMSAGKLTADIVDAFNAGGVSLSKKANTLGWRCQRWRHDLDHPGRHAHAHRSVTRVG